MGACRITVLKCLFDEELKRQYVPDPEYGPCPFFRPGEVYQSDGTQPEGFRCGVAWKSIRDEVQAFAGGDNPFFGDRPQVVCCNDGIRPVLFLLEKTERASG